MIYNFPFRVLVEKDAEGRIAEFLESLRLGKRCIIITDEVVRKIIAGRIKDSISAAFDIEIMMPDSLERAHLESLSRNISRFDFCLAIGGGKVLDMAKYSSHAAGKPWIAFPTRLSHDGIVSSSAAITENGTKVSAPAAGPCAIVADLDTLKNADYMFMAAGCGDLISNISAVNDWKIAEEDGKERYNPVVAGLSMLAAETAIENSEAIKSRSYEGTETLFWSLVLSGFAMSMHGSSRPCSGSEHSFSHALDKITQGNNGNHGEQVALGTIISLYLQKQDWEKTRAVIKGFGLPVTAKDLGISAETAVKALAAARSIRERYSILNRHRLDEKECRNVLEAVGVI